MSFKRCSVNSSDICGVAQCSPWPCHWAVLPLSHPLDLAGATCPVAMGFRMVFLVTSPAEAFSVSDEPLYLSLATTASVYPEWVAKGSANPLPSPSNYKLYSLPSMGTWTRVTFCGQVIGPVPVQNTHLPLSAH